MAETRFADLPVYTTRRQTDQLALARDAGEGRMTVANFLKDITAGPGGDGTDQTARDAAAAAQRTADTNATAIAANATAIGANMQAITQEAQDRTAADAALGQRIDAIPTGRELSVVPTGNPTRVLTLPENYRTYDIIFLNWTDSNGDAEVSLSIDLLPDAGNRTYRSGGPGRITWNAAARTFTLAGVRGADVLRNAELYQAGVASPSTGPGGVDQTARDAAAANARAITAIDGRVTTLEGRSTTVADGSITTDKLADGAVTNAKLADGAVNAGKLADDSVTSRKIAADAITSGLIADDAVDSEHIARDAIRSEHIGADQVGRSEIAGEAVSLAELDPDVLRRIDAKANAADIPRKATNTDVDVNKTPAAEAAADDTRFLTSRTGYRLTRRVTGERVTTAEKTAGTATGPRTMSPKDVVDIIDAHESPTGVDNVARQEAGNAQRTADENRVEISAEETQRRAGDQSLQRQINAIHAGQGPIEGLDLDPSRIDNRAALQGRTFTASVHNPTTVADNATRAVLVFSRPDMIVGVPVGAVTAWDASTNRMQFTVTAAQWAALQRPNSPVAADTRHARMALVFFPATGAADDISNAVTIVEGLLAILPESEADADFTGADKAKLDRYTENPRANGAAELAPLVTLDTMRRIAYNANAISSGNIAPGTFMIGGNPQGIFARFTDLDAEATAFLDVDLPASIGTVATALGSWTMGAQGWTARVAGDFSGISVGDAVHFSLGPKMAAAGGANFDQIEDFARKDLDVDVPADKTLNPLFDPDNVPFQFGASTADPTASGSKAQVTARPRYGTALSDTAVTTEVNAIPDATLTLTQEQVTHAGALIIVDCELANLASDRFTGVELILRTPTGTVVSRHSLPSSATSSNPNLRFPLTGLVAGGDLQFALGATVRGREQQVIVTLSNLRYQRDGAAPAESYVRDWAKQEVAKEAAVHEARDARIEMELVSGDQTLPAPTGVGARRSPRWDAAGAAHQRQAAADAFVIPASGYAQFHMTGEAAWASPILHVNEWKVPQTMRLYSDTLGAIQLFSDGTRVFLQNRNAAGNGAYPNQSLLLLGRGFQWFTWPEEPPAAGVVSLLTEDQVNALVMQQINALMGRLPTKDQLELFIRRNPVAVFGLTDAANIAWNVNDGLLAAVTLAGNRTIANPTNVRTGDVLVVELIQDATGGRTVTWGSNFRWPDDEAPTLSTDPNSRDIATFFALSPTVLVGGPIVPDHE